MEAEDDERGSPARPISRGVTSEAPSEATGVPRHVVEMAEDQAQHIQQIVEEAQDAEARRDRETKACPENRREHLVKRHERERDTEVLKIKRMREEHAMLLERAMRDDLPEYVQGGRDYGKSPKKKDVGTTNQELAFLKDIYGKVEGSRDLLQQKRLRDAAQAMRQRSLSSRLAMSTARSYGFGPLPSNRGSLLNEKKDLLLRLHALVSVEENIAMQPGGAYSTNRSGASARSHQNLSGFSSRRSGRQDLSHLRGRGGPGPLSMRSATTSQASGATFCPANTSKEHIFPVPQNVPPLRFRR